MYFYLVAFALLLHVLLWGAGLAMIAMPGRWRKFWSVLVVPAGLTLQALIVWLGSLIGLRGTNSYAWASEVIPAALLVWALRWRGVKVAKTSTLKLWPVWLAVVAVLALLVRPASQASKGLTTASLGSCDAADYAAGARVLMEFARGDREGFLGLTEVVRVMSVDNFFEYWTRLNHFVPAALIALNGTILDCAPYELTGLMTMVLLAGSLPVVFWTARAVLGYRGGVSVAIAVLYGISPITWYAVAHVAMGQLLAAQAIALLTWAGVAGWRGRIEGRGALAFSGVLGLGYALVLGSYNFILLVSLAPAAMYAGGRALWSGQWRRLGWWMLAMVAPLIGAGVIFWERVAGLAERLALLQQYDFGWKIPVLSPAGWLGMVATTELAAWPGIAGWAVAVAAGGLGLAAFAWGMRQKRRSAYAALCLLVPPLIGYGFLSVRGAQLGTNASYDAYKVLAVFYPGVLGALVYGVTWAKSGWRKGLVIGLGGAVMLLNLRVTLLFSEQMKRPPLIVGRELVQVQSIETRANVASLNLFIPDMWSRLWANALLLRKPHYFPTHTYEARLNTPLRGAWDLNGGLVSVQLPDGGSERINGQFSIAATTDRHFLRASLGDGWYEPEQLARTGERWQWTKGDATLRLENPQGQALRAVARFKLRSEEPRDLQLWMNGQRLNAIEVDVNLTEVRTGEILIPAGKSVLELRSGKPPTRVGAGDARALGWAIYGLEIEVKKDGDPVN